MIKIFLGLGSNVGNKAENIKRAVSILSKNVYKTTLSRFYVSKAVGYKYQPDFINAVLKGYTDLSPTDLLEFIKDVEKDVGRVYRFHWGPREIDIDILFYGDKIINEDYLTVPHPRLHERDFVLLPLIELEPDLVHPVYRKTVKELLDFVNERSVIDIL
jgi:2-amino-4-hydroxy-6-hydroxymethyldihydropteridine diphosphokinase